MKLSSLTVIGFETNAVLDSAPGTKISFNDIHDAAERKQLVQFLAERFGDEADLSLLLSDPVELAEVNNALCDAACALQGRERKKVGIVRNGLGLMIAIVLEAIQQQFIPLLPDNAPHFA
jgi:hypothetical protein